MAEANELIPLFSHFYRYFLWATSSVEENDDSFKNKYSLKLQSTSLGWGPNYKEIYLAILELSIKIPEFLFY